MSLKVTVGELLFRLKQVDDKRVTIKLVVMDPIMQHLRMDGTLYAVKIEGEIVLYATGDLNG